MRHYAAAAAKQHVKDLYSSYMKIKQSLKDCIFKSAAGGGENEKIQSVEFIFQQCVGQYHPQ